MQFGTASTCDSGVIQERKIYEEG